MSSGATARGVAEALFQDFGGFDRFWLAWVEGAVPQRARDWLRGEARALGLEQAVAAADAPWAARDLADAVEAASVLAEGAPTNLGVMTSGALRNQPDAVRRHFRNGMYDLLEEIGVRMPAEADEQAQARRLLERLAGAESVRRFRELHDWLTGFRGRLDDPDGGSALDRALLALAPDLGRRDAGAFTHHLSFRLHLRNRLLHHCEDEGWSSEQGDLYSALSRLDRDWMAMLLGRAASQLEEFWDRVRAPLSEEPVPAGVVQG